MQHFLTVVLGRNSFNLSSFLCWQSLKKSYQQTDHNFCSKRLLEVLLDNFTILTPFFTHVYWMNEALTQGFGSIACSEQKRSAAYLGALPAKESICVTQPFQPENCPNCHPTKICGLHSSEAIAAFVLRSMYFANLINLIDLVDQVSTLQWATLILISK